MAEIGDSVSKEFQEELDKLAKDMNPENRGRNKRRRRRRPPPVIRYAFVSEDKEYGPVFNPRENAGIDLYALTDVDFHATSAGGNYVATVPTTFIIEFPYGVHGLVAGRSGNAFKRDTIPFYGIIDNSYRGNTAVRLYTHDTEVAKQGIKRGTAVGQLILLNYAGYSLLNARLQEVTLEELTKTTRGDKGFGSSGNNV